VLKIAFVGAGSVVFTKNLLTDILGFTELRGASIAAWAPHMAVQNLTVRAALEGRRDHVYHAAMLDRHAPSVLSLDEIAAMVDELIKAHGDAMPEGIRASGVRRRST